MQCLASTFFEGFGNVLVFAVFGAAFVFITLVGIVALVLVRALCPADRPLARKPLGYLASYRTVLSDRWDTVWPSLSGRHKVA